MKLAHFIDGLSNTIGLFHDTQFEHPLTYAHLDAISGYYGVDIAKITAGSVEEEIRKFRMFPGSGGARHCTKALKIRPAIEFYRLLSQYQGEGFDVWHGVRSRESDARSKRYKEVVSFDKYALHEVMPSAFPKELAALGVRAVFPIIDWTEQEVFTFLEGEVNPLYKMGFGRVGCFPCLAAGDKAKLAGFQFDEVGRKHYQLVKALEKEIGRSVFTTKKASEFKDELDGPGCSFCAM